MTTVNKSYSSSIHCYAETSEWDVLCISCKSAVFKNANRISNISFSSDWKRHRSQIDHARQTTINKGRVDIDYCSSLWNTFEPLGVVSSVVRTTKSYSGINYLLLNLIKASRTSETVFRFDLGVERVTQIWCMRRLPSNHPAFGSRRQNEEITWHWNDLSRSVISGILFSSLVEYERQEKTPCQSNLSPRRRCSFRLFEASKITFVMPPFDVRYVNSIVDHGENKSCVVVKSCLIGLSRRLMFIRFIRHDFDQYTASSPLSTVTRHSSRCENKAKETEKKKEIVQKKNEWLSQISVWSRRRERNDIFINIPQEYQYGK